MFSEKTMWIFTNGIAVQIFSCAFFHATMCRVSFTLVLTFLCQAIAYSTQDAILFL